jgi:hypothetical protein
MYGHIQSYEHFIRIQDFGGVCDIFIQYMGTFIQTTVSSTNFWLGVSMAMLSMTNQ